MMVLTITNREWAVTTLSILATGTTSHLTVLTTEPSWTITLGVVSDSSAQSSVFTQVIAALHRSAVILAGGSGAGGLLS